jgi:pyruvate/2-oxoglutarate/acetoin dehydrogenase E1 component
MADEQGLDQDRLVWMFTQMLRIREFEERVKRSFTELPGLLRGHTHLADGAEASIVGSLAALRPGDQILTTYRCHGYPIVLGTDPKTMMAEIFGKRTGLCGGYGGSMHLTDVARGFLGTSGIVGLPLVLKAGYGFTAGWAGQHTGSIYGMFMGVPGLKIALPATAADAKGLMATAIRDDNPVVFFHHYLLTLTPGEVPEGEHLVPFGSADIRRPGGDVTIVATGWMVHRALAAAERLAGEGVSAEVIDPRTLAPLDTATVIESVSKTGHLVLVDQATRHASASAVIAAEVADAGFGYLKAPIKQVTGLDTPIPYSKPMEEHVLPNEDKIVEAVRQVLSTTLVT